MSSRGVVLCALNNSSLNYIKLAEFCATRVDKFLGVPVTLITDELSLASISSRTLFDSIKIVQTDNYSSRTFRDGAEIVKKTEWKNSHRDSVYELSPYDETLVLDVDYIVNSNILNSCWGSNYNFLIYKKSFDLGQRKNTTEFNFISEYSIDFYWATVFWFRKNQMTQAFFSLITHIKSNWDYYKLIYQIDSVTFRNDFAFSIALHLMNGGGIRIFETALPSKLFYTIDTDYLSSIENQTMTFLVKQEGSTDNYTPVKTTGLDVHVMNKFSLLRVINNE